MDSGTAALKVRVMLLFFSITLGQELKLIQLEIEPETEQDMFVTLFEASVLFRIKDPETEAPSIPDKAISPVLAARPACTRLIDSIIEKQNITHSKLFCKFICP